MASTRVEIQPEVINYTIQDPNVGYMLEGFDQDWNILDKHYVGDPDVVAAKIEAVANQGKAKK